MQPYTRVTGIVAPMDRANVDTDQIITAHMVRQAHHERSKNPFVLSQSKDETS